MHLCPIDNELFHNNLAMLSKYLHVFNGKKIIHVAQSKFYDPNGEAGHNNLLPMNVERHESPPYDKSILPLAERLNRQRFKGDKKGFKKTLMDLFSYHKIDTSQLDFRLSPNNVKVCETKPFQEILLPAVYSLDPNDITFYCHSKGVTRHDPSRVSAVRKWTRFLYEKNLEDISRIENILRSTSQFTCAGTLRISELIHLQVDNVHTRQHTNCPWHYSGTFFWFNNKKLFSNPSWQEVPDSRWGVECYLGRQVPIRNSYCLDVGARSGGDLYTPKAWEFLERALDSPSPLPKKEENLPFYDCECEKGVYDKQGN